METFKPGDKVRVKGAPQGYVFLIVVGGYVEMKDFHFHSTDRPFTSKDFELVEEK